MGQALPTQHPAVVLRSHYEQLRALLALAVIAVVSLTAAVVVLATHDDSGAGTGSATQVSTPAPTGSTRYDGGPEEGSRAIVPAKPPSTPGCSSRCFSLPVLAQCSSGSRRPPRMPRSWSFASSIAATSSPIAPSTRTSCGTQAILAEPTVAIRLRQRRT